MLVINPDPFLLPTYRISPFTTAAVGFNATLSQKFDVYAKAYFDERFGQENWIITQTGREAISFALSLLNVHKETKVSLITTSGNTYISSCVTSEIERACKYTNTDEGDICFVNHEFGYVFDGVNNLVKLGKPVIEDCCTTFFSQDQEKKVGLYGDFSLFSFPKFFNIQIGGLLVGHGVGTMEQLHHKSKITEDTKDYILKVVGFELSREEELLEKRYEIFKYAKARFEELGFSLRFPERLGEVPSVLLLNNHGRIKDLPKHKDYLNKHGIQNSVFYGEDAFFLPCHQNLSKVDVDYFKFVTENFIENE